MRIKFACLHRSLWGLNELNHLEEPRPVVIFSANCCRSGLPAILKEYAFYFVLFFLLLLSLPGMFFLPYSSGKFMLIFENSAQRYLVISDDNPIRPHQGSVCSCKAQKHPHPLVGLCSGVLWGSQNDRSGSTGLCGRLRAWPPQFPQLCLLMCWQPLWAGVRLPSDSGLPSLQDSGWKRMRGSLLSGRERKCMCMICLSLGLVFSKLYMENISWIHYINKLWEQYICDPQTKPVKFFIISRGHPTVGKGLLFSIDIQSNFSFFFITHTNVSWIQKSNFLHYSACFLRYKSYLQWNTRSCFKCTLYV